MSESTGPLLRHVAGATVSHAGPFKNLPLPTCERKLTQEERDEWVAPFYKSIEPAQQVPLALALWDKITQKQVTLLLSQFGWRERTSAVRLAYLKDIEGIETIVGNLLLRSDVCFVGSDYCFILAQYNTKQSITFFCKYLDYYLGQQELFFDQGDAMAALIWLDEQNQTRIHEKYLDKWTQFVKNKPHWDLAQSADGFQRFIDSMNEWKCRIYAHLDR